MRQKFLLYHWFLLKNVENFTIETDCFCQFFKWPIFGKNGQFLEKKNQF